MFLLKISFKLPTVAMSRTEGDLFHDSQVRHAVGSTAVLIRLRADIPAAAQRFVDADNGKALVGASDCQRTPDGTVDANEIYPCNHCSEEIIMAGIGDFPGLVGADFHAVNRVRERFFQASGRVIGRLARSVATMMPCDARLISMRCP
jgi:hypothetical protein